MNSYGVPQAAPIQNEPMPGRRGYAGEKVLCIPVLLPRVARELLPARAPEKLRHAIATRLRAPELGTRTACGARTARRRR